MPWSARGPAHRQRLRALCAASGGVASREDHPVGVELQACDLFTVTAMG